MVDLHLGQIICLFSWERPTGLSPETTVFAHCVLPLNSAAFIDLKISKIHIVHIFFAVLQLHMQLQVLNATGYLLYQLLIVINETFWCRLRARIKLCFH